MKMKKIALFLMVISFIFCGIAYVQPCYAQRDAGRYACQQDVRMDLEKAYRIVKHGIQTRQINQQEAEGIRHNLKRVESDLDRALSDGRLNPRECDRLQRETRDLYRHIRQDMTDNDGDRQGRGGQACQRDVRDDLEKARIAHREGVDSRRINPQESYVISNKMEEVEKDLRRSLKDGRLNPGECDKLKRKMKDLYDLIGYARNN